MKILIAVEDKEFGDAIANFVCNHPRWKDQVEFKVIHALEPLYMGPITGYPVDVLDSYEEERRRAGKSLVMAVGTRIRQSYPSAEISEEVVDGQPKVQIIDTAKEWNADLIVLGSHGRTGIGRFLLGSVSMSVLSAAPCSVMIVKLPHQKERAQEQAREAAVSK